MVVVTPATALFTYLATRFLRYSTDQSYHLMLVKDAEDTIDKLQKIKKKYPEKSKEINAAIKKIQDQIDEDKRTVKKLLMSINNTSIIRSLLI